MYRPQFAYPFPLEPCTDQACMYAFDQTNLPSFRGVILAGGQTGRIPLRLDKDADFYLRAIATQGNVDLRLEDANGNPLSDCDNAQNSQNFEDNNEYSHTNGFGFVALESGAGGVFAPAGGNFVVYLYNPGVATLQLNTCSINLIGVKRYQHEVCKA